MNIFKKREDPLKLEVSFRNISGFGGNWADKIQSDVELDFPILLALYNAGKGHGWRIGWEKKCLGEGYVYDPYEIYLHAEYTSSCGSGSKGVDLIDIRYQVESYSLKSIYEGTLMAIKTAETKHEKRREWPVELSYEQVKEIYKQLLPCPFCGSKAQICGDKELYNEPLYNIACSNEKGKHCEAQFPWLTNIEKAIEDWNRRPNP